MNSTEILAAVDNMTDFQLETRLRQASARKHRGAHTLLIPCNLGNAHWIGLLFALKAGGQLQHAEYIDSLNSSISAVPKTFQIQLQAVYPEASFEIRLLLQQSDNCIFY